MNRAKRNNTDRAKRNVSKENINEQMPQNGDDEHDKGKRETENSEMDTEWIRRGPPDPTRRTPALHIDTRYVDCLIYT